MLVAATNCAEYPAKIASRPSATARCVLPPPGGPRNALEFLQAVYRDTRLPLTTRIHRAVEALPFEAPKLSAVAVTSMRGEDFAARLDRCLARSARAMLIEAKA
jgi:hypothetical protein